MTVEDFLIHYRATSFCVENDQKKYFHSLGKKDSCSKSQIYYSFDLQEDIDCSESVFSISCYQQGDRLAHYRLKDENGFSNSSFNIVLLKDKTWIKGGCNNYPSFNNSVVIDDRVLTAGTYHVCIDPIWEEKTTSRDPGYKNIIVDVYSN